MAGSTFRRSAGLALLLALGIAMTPPSPAAASSTASLAGGTVTITGSAAAEDISFGGNSYLERYIEDATGIVPGPGCTEVRPTEVDCGSYTQVIAHLGGGNDKFLAGLVSQPMSVYGEDGDDTVYGGSAADTIDGGAGNDFLDGNGGNDRTDGGPGDDTVWAGGDAIITGGPGRDSLYGGSRNELGGGNSTVNANDGEIDQVSCGVTGTSIVHADPADVVDPLCTQVERVGVQRMRLTLSSASSRITIATLLKRGYRFDCAFATAGAVAAQLYVPASQARRLHLRKGTPIASTSGRVDAGSYRITLRVKSRYRAAVRRARSFTASLMVVAADGAKHTDSVTRRVTVTR